MKFKDLIIKVNDFLFYVGFAIICLISAIMGATGGGLYGALFGLVGLLALSILSGAWFVLSSIADSAQRQVILTEKQNKLIEKLNHNLEAHLHNQFGDV